MFKENKRTMINHPNELQLDELIDKKLQVFQAQYDNDINQLQTDINQLQADIDQLQANINNFKTQYDNDINQLQANINYLL